MTVSPQITVHSETNTATWSYMYLLSPWSPRSATTQVGKSSACDVFLFLFFFWKYHNLKKNNNTFLKYLPMFYVRLYYTFVCIYFLFNRRKQTYFILLRTSFSVADFSVNEVWCSPYFTTHRLSHCNPMCSVLDDITPPERLVKPSTPPAMTFCMHGEHARRHAAN